MKEDVCWKDDWRIGEKGLGSVLPTRATHHGARLVLVLGSFQSLKLEREAREVKEIQPMKTQQPQPPLFCFARGRSVRFLTRSTGVQF
jgi:hypothetical protein